jgi:acyl-CoA thioesterase-2
MPDVPLPTELEESSWSDDFGRRFVPESATPMSPVGAGRIIAWMRVSVPLAGDDLLRRCWLAYLSDDLPCDVVVRAHPRREAIDGAEGRFIASLDHSVWFHASPQVERWHLYDVTCLAFAGGRGVTLGHAFDADGAHVATFTQEALVRERLAR